MPNNEKIEDLTVMGRKYVGKFVRDTGYGHSGKIGNCVGFEIGTRLNGVWLKLDIGTGTFAHVYRHQYRGRNG